MFGKKRAYRRDRSDPPARFVPDTHDMAEPHSPDQPPRDALILQYAPFIKYIAGRIAVRLPPHIDINDVINAGVLGLMDAIDKFDASKGVLFKTYAEFRIRGAILDSLRDMDWVPRSVRKTVATLERTYAALERENGRPATDEEVAAALNIDTEKLHALLSQASGVTLLSLDMLSHHEDTHLKLIDCLTGDDAETPLTFLKNRELSALVAAAIEELPEKEQTVVSLYYYDDLTMKEISQIMHLTESRVSQLHTKALLRLRGRLQEIADEI